jgi:hypothetical protein
MLQCWKVLVPLKMLDGCGNAISSLEKLAWRPEMIELTPSGRIILGAPDDGGCQQPLVIHPYPP